VGEEGGAFRPVGIGSQEGYTLSGFVFKKVVDKKYRTRTKRTKQNIFLTTEEPQRGTGNDLPFGGQSGVFLTGETGNVTGRAFGEEGKRELAKAKMKKYPSIIHL